MSVRLLNRREYDLYEMFKKNVDSCKPKNIVIACSGGADSICMLMLFYYMKVFSPRDREPRMMSVYVNHGLRKEGSEEALFVKEFSNMLGIPNITTWVNVQQGNVEEQCRLARYKALHEICGNNPSSFIAVGHHKSDQIENHLMYNLGLVGFGHMRIRNERLMRPLLNCDKSEIDYFVRDINIVKDPMNEDETYMRVRVRKFIKNELIKKFGEDIINKISGRLTY